jgi:hypothetical protein
MDEQRFMLIRRMIALAQVDGKYTDDEDRIDEDRIVRERARVLNLSAQQKQTLDEDRHDPVDPIIIYEGMPNLTAKGLFLSVARNIFHADGEFCAAQQAVMAKLEKIHEQALIKVLPGLRQALRTVRETANIEIMDARTHQPEDNQNPLTAVWNWIFRA